MPAELIESIQAKAKENRFSGVVSIKLNDLSYCEAFGYQDRANQLPNTRDTRFGTASGTKGFTALGIASLIDDGSLDLETTAHSILRPAFPSLHPEITISQLLQHTSGIGDHLDEEELDGDIDDFLLPVPVQNLKAPTDYIPLLEAIPQKFPPGQRACYSNGGYVLLSIIIETLTAKSFPQFIQERIFDPANMTESGFFRTDLLPANTAFGYLGDHDSLRTNVFNLPIIGSGDGGAYSTIADMDRFWSALKGHRIVSEAMLQLMWTPHTSFESSEYGLGFYLEPASDLVALSGHDAGVSFYSATKRSAPDCGFSLLSNTTSGVWPLLELLEEDGRFVN